MKFKPLGKMLIFLSYVLIIKVKVTCPRVMTRRETKRLVWYIKGAFVVQAQKDGFELARFVFE